MKYITVIYFRTNKVTPPFVKKDSFERAIHILNPCLANNDAVSWGKDKAENIHKEIDGVIKESVRFRTFELGEVGFNLC